MIIEIKDYFSLGEPTDEDIIEAIELAKKNNCIINLIWFIEYSGRYNQYIRKEDTLKIVKERLPKIYGI